MWVSLSLLLLAFLRPAMGLVGCVMCPEEDSLLPHPTDCTSYIRCEGRQAIFLTCPEGHVFHQASQSCRSSTITQCVEESGPRELVSCPSGILNTQAPRDSGSLSTEGACSNTCTDYESLVNTDEVHSVCAAETSTCLNDHLVRGVKVEEEWVLVAAHNSRRQRLAIGVEDGSALPSNLPSATNMNALVWNGELAKVAQALADTCSDYSDCEHCRRITSRKYEVGQNPFWVWTTSAARPEYDALVEQWYSEVQYVSDLAWIVNYTNPDGVVIKHFTQVAWALTEEVGCGWAAVDKGSWVSHIVICNYGPG
ncbi:hypothetical protein Pcinc_016813 [Petrolisthes cinctipes]|uniref:Chitin-binding type-2 domain-containing protein n=1 Tax=Petrolisthes cinctipes TaxID=88211 RepID=A0AAE1FVG0_PETCI|nr:hypothetical protein Pcinc_016813 [Petrolisthes cinctipes]